MRPFLTTGNLLAFPFVWAIMKSGSEVCVSCAWVMAVGGDG